MHRLSFYLLLFLCFESSLLPLVHAGHLDNDPEENSVKTRARADVNHEMGNQASLEVASDDKNQIDSDCYLDALKILGADKDQDLTAQACIGLGNVFAFNRMNEGALSYYNQALDLASSDNLLSKI